MKALVRSPIFQTVTGFLVAGYMHLVRVSTRWNLVSPPDVDAAWRGDAGPGGIIVCLWHSRLMMAYSVWRKECRPAAILVSRSSDGEFVAQAAERLGNVVMRGSTRNPKKDKGKGGGVAYRDMLEFVADGGCMCMMPDGPRGPRMRARLGAVKLAAATQAPLLPHSASTRWRIVFKSWDRFVLPLPFSRGEIHWGPVIAPPATDADADALEAKRQELEAAMIAINQSVDDAVGAEPIEPGPPLPAAKRAEPT